jgi:hypothetical protein
MCLDGVRGREESLRFVKREGGGYPGNVGHHAGTTSQEVLRALIDRAEYVDNQERHVANTIAIANMKMVVWMYEQRAADRHGRSLDFGIAKAVYGKTCDKCGHVGCEGECHE